MVGQVAKEPDLFQASLGLCPDLALLGELASIAITSDSNHVSIIGLQLRGGMRGLGV